MLRRMTAKQFLDWQAYAAVEPFGELRQDYRIASVVAALYNINRDTKKRKDPFPLEDFLLKFSLPEAPKKTQTWQQQKSIAYAIVAAYSKSKKKPTRS